VSFSFIISNFSRFVASNLFQLSKIAHFIGIFISRDTQWPKHHNR
jgi:hypothetical protein